MKSDMSKRADKAKIQDAKYREMPDIVVKVVCRYRAELFFKISRKTKLSRLFGAWTERMETGAGVGLGGGPGLGKKGDVGGGGGVPGKGTTPGAQPNGTAKSDAASTSSGSNSSGSISGSNMSMQFIFTHNGRSVDSDQTPEEAGMEDGDEILAVELMDLTEDGAFGAAAENGENEDVDVKIDEWEEIIEPRRQKLRKNWTDNPKECVVPPVSCFDCDFYFYSGTGQGERWRRSSTACAFDSCYLIYVVDWIALSQCP